MHKLEGDAVRDNFPVDDDPKFAESFAQRKKHYVYMNESIAVVFSSMFIIAFILFIN
jgi:hypothetical protein